MKNKLEKILQLDCSFETRVDLLLSLINSIRKESVEDFAKKLNNEVFNFMDNEYKRKGDLAGRSVVSAVADSVLHYLQAEEYLNGSAEKDDTEQNETPTPEEQTKESNTKLESNTEQSGNTA